MEFNVDTRLIAAVQRSAGARCHQAANLLQSYELAAALLQRPGLGEYGPEAQETREIFEDSEVALRRFLFECRTLGCSRSSDGRRSMVFSAQVECSF